MHLKRLQNKFPPFSNQFLLLNSFPSHLEAHKIECNQPQSNSAKSPLKQSNQKILLNFFMCCNVYCHKVRNRKTKGKCRSDKFYWRSEINNFNVCLCTQNEIRINSREAMKAIHVSPLLLLSPSRSRLFLVMDAKSISALFSIKLIRINLGYKREEEVYWTVNIY